MDVIWHLGYGAEKMKLGEKSLFEIAHELKPRLSSLERKMLN